MPAKGKSKVSARQRATIAAGKVHGKTSQQVAHETGLTAETIRKHWSDDRTFTILQEAKEDSRGELLKAYRYAVQRVNRIMRKKDDDLFLRAAARLQGLISVGDPPLARLSDPIHDLPPGDFLLEEALLLYRRMERGENI